jgi:hypothetical protein
MQRQGVAGDRRSDQEVSISQPAGGGEDRRRGGIDRDSTTIPHTCVAGPALVAGNNRLAVRSASFMTETDTDLETETETETEIEAEPVMAHAMASGAGGTVRRYMSGLICVVEGMPLEHLAILEGATSPVSSESGSDIIDAADEEAVAQAGRSAGGEGVREHPHSGTGVVGGLSPLPDGWEGALPRAPTLTPSDNGFPSGDKQVAQPGGRSSSPSLSSERAASLPLEGAGHLLLAALEAATTPVPSDEEEDDDTLPSQ